MKTNKILNQLLILVMLFAFTKGYSQFQTASVTESATGFGLTSATHTGNDITIVSGSTYLSVSVWDDSGGSPGITGDDGSNVSTVGFTYTDAEDPDVCLVKNNSSTIYAIAVYHSPGIASRYVMEVFAWSGTALSSISLANLGTTSGNVCINIDGNPLGDFVIVNDDGSNGIRSFTGFTTGGAPTLHNSGASFYVNAIIPNPGSMPDVCLRDTNGTTILANYIYMQNGGVELDVERWVDITAGPANPQFNVIQAFPPAGTIANPRIACPNDVVGWSTDIAIIYEDFGGGNFDIIAQVSCSSATGYIFNARNFTNGTITNLNPLLRTEINRNPVVTYDYAGNVLFVAWTLDNSGNNWSGGGTPATQGIFPIMLGLTYRGTNPVFNPIILEVPDSPVNFQDYLSIAGRFCPDNIYTFWDNVNADIYYKPVAETNTNLRLAAKGIQKFSAFPNPFHDGIRVLLSSLSPGNYYGIKITDILGKQIYSNRLPADNLNNELVIFSGSLQKGIYLISIKPDDGELSYVEKILKL